LGAALTEQQANQISPLGSFLTGASKDPRLQTGFENLFSGFGQPSGMTGAQNDLLAAQGKYYRQPSTFSYDGQQI
jgi:hypothetical protein